MKAPPQRLKAVPCTFQFHAIYSAIPCHPIGNLKALNYLEGKRNSSSLNSSQNWHIVQTCSKESSTPIVSACSIARSVCVCVTLGIIGILLDLLSFFSTAGGLVVHASTSPTKRLALNTDIGGDAHRRTCTFSNISAWQEAKPRTSFRRLARHDVILSARRSSSSFLGPSSS